MALQREAVSTNLRGDGEALTRAADATPARDTEWRCPSCSRVFRRVRQPHSCRTVDLEEHLPRGDALRSLFDHLLSELNSRVGRCEVVSLPCCVHLFGTHDFLAVLPRKERLEIRFTLQRELENSRVKLSARISKTSYKHSVDIRVREDIDETLLSWLREAYHPERQARAAAPSRTPTAR